MKTLEKNMKFTLAILITISSVAASEITAEQRQLMKEFHLTVPPVILDKNGVEKKISNVVAVVPDIAAAKIQLADILDDAAETPKVVPKKEVVVKTVDADRQIDAVFGPSDPVELPLAPSPANKHAVVTATDATFGEIINKGIVVVDFWASWCIPCTQFKSVFEGSAATSDATFVRVDFDSEKALTNKYGVHNLPCVIVFKDGIRVESHVGSLDGAALRQIVASASSGEHSVVTQAPREVKYSSTPQEYRSEVRQSTFQTGWKSRR